MHIARISTIIAVTALAQASMVHAQLDEGCGVTTTPPFCATDPTVTCEDPLTLDLEWDFDSGSLNLSASCQTGTTEISVISRRTYFDRHAWVQFQVSPAEKQQWPTSAVSFRILSNCFFGDTSAFTYPLSQLVWSYDQVEWNYFETGTPVNQFGFIFYEFDAGDAFDQNESQVYVALQFPYPVSKTTAHTASVVSSPYTSNTLSSDPATFLIGLTPGGTDSAPGATPRMIPQQPLYGYRISDDSATGPKSKIVLVGGNHAGEMLGNFVLEGMIDFLLGSDPMAVSIRQRAEVFVYPQVNPEGRYAGFYRSSVQQPNYNSNRIWDCAMAGGDKILIRDSMLTDVGGPVDILLDFHSQFAELYDPMFPDEYNDEVIVTNGDQFDDYVTNLDGVDAIIVEADPADEHPGKLRIWGSLPYDGTDGGFGADLAITPEPRPAPGRSIDDFRAHGEIYGRSLYLSLPCSGATCEGDINGDGTVDTLDLLIVLAGWTSCCDGDVNCDGVVDTFDLLIVLAAWGPCP